MKIKILAAQTHKSSPHIMNATDYLRIVSPFSQLKLHGWNVVVQDYIVPQEIAFAKDPLDKRLEQAYLDIGDTYDLVWCSYNHSVVFFYYLQALQDRGLIKTVYDYDDNLLHLDLRNPTVLNEMINDPWEELKIHTTIEQLQYICTPSKHIAQDYMNMGEKKTIFHIPNYIDSDLYIPQPKREKKEFVIGFFGSASHQSDVTIKPFFKALKYIRNKYPHVRFEMITKFDRGFVQLLHPDTHVEGSPHYFDWVKLCSERVSQWDVAVAPLRDTRFNKSRSELKYLESGAMGVPLIASDIGLYTSPNVLVAQTKDEWIRHLSHLVEDKEYRDNIGKQAQADVFDNLTIQKNWSKWAVAIEQIESDY